MKYFSHDIRFRTRTLPGSKSFSHLLFAVFAFCVAHHSSGFVVHAGQGSVCPTAVSVERAICLEHARRYVSLKKLLEIMDLKQEVHTSWKRAKIANRSTSGRQEFCEQIIILEFLQYRKKSTAVDALNDLYSGDWVATAAKEGHPHALFKMGERHNKRALVWMQSGDETQAASDFSKAYRYFLTAFQRGNLGGFLSLPSVRAQLESRKIQYKDLTPLVPHRILCQVRDLN